MEQQDNRVHFRKTLYFKMVIVTVFLGFTFFWLWDLSISRVRNGSEKR